MQFRVWLMPMMSFGKVPIHFNVDVSFPVGLRAAES